MLLNFGLSLFSQVAALLSHLQTHLVASKTKPAEEQLAEVKLQTQEQLALLKVGKAGLVQFYEDLSQTHAHLLAEKVGRAAVELACVLSQIIEQFCGLNTGNAAVTEATDLLQ